MVDQFDSYFIEPGIHHNGKLVLGESIGDLGGAKIAYLAFQKAQQGEAARRRIDGFTPEQQFFIAWGQFRGDEIRPETQRMMVQGDPHPIAKYRVIGPLSNLPSSRRRSRCKADARDGAAGRQAVRGLVGVRRTPEYCGQSTPTRVDCRSIPEISSSEPFSVQARITLA